MSRVVKYFLSLHHQRTRVIASSACSKSAQMRTRLGHSHQHISTAAHEHTQARPAQTHTRMSTSENTFTRRRSACWASQLARNNTPCTCRLARGSARADCVQESQASSATLCGSTCAGARLNAHTYVHWHRCASFDVDTCAHKLISAAIGLDSGYFCQIRLR